MKNTFSRKFMVCALAGVLGFALSACDDSSSAGGDETETNALSCSAEMSSSSRHCEDCKDEAISSSGKSNDPAEVTDDSSDSKDSPSSAGTSTKSSNSNSSSVTPSDVEGSSKTAWDYLNPDINYGEFTDKRDGQVYKTVTIGSQTWMAENLNYNYKIGGVSVGNYCYKDSSDSCAKYGKLYTWAAAMDSATTGCGYGSECDADTSVVQGVCPDGWHLPNRAEWDSLFASTAVGGKSVAGRTLKTISGWYNNGSGTDAVGFSALPSGWYNNGSFDRAVDYAYFWSSSESDVNYAYGMHLYFGIAFVENLGLFVKNDGFSVRCIKDSE